MKVHIEGNLFLESDKHQFILKEYSGKKRSDGKRDDYEVHGYFGTIQAALKKVIKMKIKKSTTTTLSELRQDVLRIEEYIMSKFNE